MSEVESLCAVSGAIDYMLTLRCANTEVLDKLLDQIGTLDGVRQTSTSIILSKRIDRSSIRMDTDRNKKSLSLDRLFLICNCLIQILVRNLSIVL